MPGARCYRAQASREVAAPAERVPGRSTRNVPGPDAPAGVGRSAGSRRRACRSVDGTPHGYVYLLEPGEAKLEMRVGLGIYEEYAGYRLGSGEGLAGKVHESGQSLVVEDYAAWEGYSAKFGRAAFHAVAGVPLRSGSEVVGVLGLGYVDEDRMFGDEDMMLLGRFAELASVALDNARLYASAQQELTERERAEKALGKSEEQYRMLVETVQEGLGFVDAEERITYCNRAYAELYGYDEPEELLGKGWNLLYDEEQLTWFHQYVMPALRRDGHWRGEAVGKKRDGGTFPQELSISPLKGGGFVCVVRDVTERKRTEEARRESEERFRHLIEQAADALFVHDIQGKFVDANQKACDLVGYTKEELLSLSVMDIEENFDPTELVELWERVADKRSVMIEGRNIHKDGTRFPVEIHLGWFEANGERLVLATVRDVTERKQAEEKLKQSEERHRRQARELSLLHQVRTALAGELDPRAVFRTVVEAVAETYGYSLVSAYLLEDDVEGGTLVLQHHVGYQQTLPDRVPVSQSVMGRVARTGHPVLLEDVREDPDYLGAIEGVTSEVCAPLFDGGRVVGTLNVESTDGVRLTEDDLRVVGALAEHAGMAVGSARLHVRIREAEERFRAFFEHSATGISIATPDRRLIETNPAYQRMTDYTAEELHGKLIAELSHPDDGELNEQLRSGRLDLYQREKRYVRKNGETIWVRPTISTVRREDGEPRFLVGMVEDITERKALEDSLAHRATHDPLTNLPNRALLTERLGQALARAGRKGRNVALLFLDLDNFKIVNDSMGHEAGDRLLVAVAKRLKATVRTEDAVARLGGDEFVVLLEEADLEEAAQVAEKIAESLGDPFALGGGALSDAGTKAGTDPEEEWTTREVLVSTSLGIALSGPDRIREPGQLLREADLAMYRAKTEGKARHAVFEEKMDERAARRLDAENKL
ncbi:MAG: PAS domain S-box protein, partial [Actinomycetota bacterium]|nr:PAS domain S-box protein [Actinomycetota bacterium]